MKCNDGESGHKMHLSPFLSACILCLVSKIDLETIVFLSLFVFQQMFTRNFNAITLTDKSQAIKHEGTAFSWSTCH